jgi:hypothetical protein
LRRVDSASVVANVLQQVPAPASAALPQHSAGFAPSVHGDHGESGGDGGHGRHGGEADPLALPARRA